MRSLKVLLFATSLILFLSSDIKSQTNEFGLTIGLSNFYGDLGGANNIGRSLFWDYEFTENKPVIGILFRRNLSGFTAFRFQFFQGWVGGDDNLITKPGKPQSSHQWYRYVRNFNFKSPITEISTQFEVNFMRYEIGRKRYRFAPFGFIGAGVFHFNPKGKDINGNWVELKPLHTEGQGFSNYPDRKEYSLWQPCMILGLGLKYSISENWSLGFEYGHRITWTDYIDDVSKSYVALSDFNMYFADNPTKAAQAYAMSRRSLEKEENLPYYSTTDVGEQRGDPNNSDHYVFMGVVTLTYTVKKGKIYCPRF